MIALRASYDLPGGEVMICLQQSYDAPSEQLRYACGMIYNHFQMAI